MTLAHVECVQHFLIQLYGAYSPEWINPALQSVNADMGIHVAVQAEGILGTQMLQVLPFGLRCLTIMLDASFCHTCATFPASIVLVLGGT